MLFVNALMYKLVSSYYKMIWYILNAKIFDLAEINGKCKTIWYNPNTKTFHKKN